MKKKSIGIIVSLFVLVLLATPVMAEPEGRIKEPYSVSYTVSPVSPPTVDKTVGVVRIRSGSVLSGPYDGPLGIGTMTAELVIRMDNTKNLKTLVTFKNTLVITSGPYGAFTLEGSTHFKLDEDGPVSGKTVLQGMSEVGPVTIIAEKGVIPPLTVWEEGVIIHP